MARKAATSTATASRSQRSGSPAAVADPGVPDMGRPSGDGPGAPGSASVPSPRSRRYYRQLKGRMMLVMVLASLLPLTLIGVLTLSQFKSAYQAKVRAHLGLVAAKHGQSLGRFLGDRRADLKFLARSTPLARLRDSDLLRTRLAWLRQEYGGAFVDLGLVDPAGRQVAYAGPFNLAGVDYARAGWFTRSRGRESFVSDVFAGLRRTPHFIIVVAKRFGARQWSLRATVDFESFNALVGHLRLGRTGVAFILNRQARPQTSVPAGVDLAAGPYRRLISALPPSGRTTVVELPGPGGGRWLFALSPIMNGRWILVLQQRAGDALHFYYQARRLVMLVLVLCGALILAGAWFCSGWIVGRIALADEDKRALDEKLVAAARLAAIGQLAAGVAHEVNNPVAIMVEEAGWIGDLLQDGTPVSAQDRDELCRAAAEIKSQGRRCQAVTRRLLGFARQTDDPAVPCDLNDLAGRAVNLLRRRAAGAKVEIAFRRAEDLPEVLAPPSQLEQVLFNLINNALDALADQGGRIELATGTAGERVFLKVHDNGPGVPPEALPRIFDPFFTTKPVGQGTGLGLSICYSVVRKLGGSITVQSLPGQGTTFVVELPVAGSDRELGEGAARRQTTHNTHHGTPGAPAWNQAARSSGGRRR